MASIKSRLFESDPKKPNIDEVASFRGSLPLPQAEAPDPVLPESEGTDAFDDEPDLPEVAGTDAFDDAADDFAGRSEVIVAAAPPEVRAEAAAAAAPFDAQAAALAGAFSAAPPEPVEPPEPFPRGGSFADIINGESDVEENDEAVIAKARIALRSGAMPDGEKLTLAYHLNLSDEQAQRIRDLLIDRGIYDPQPVAPPPRPMPRASFAPAPAPVFSAPAPAPAPSPAPFVAPLLAPPPPPLLSMETIERHKLSEAIVDQNWSEVQAMIDRRNMSRTNIEHALQEAAGRMFALGLVADNNAFCDLIDENIRLSFSYTSLATEARVNQAYQRIQNESKARASGGKLSQVRYTEVSELANEAGLAAAIDTVQKLIAIKGALSPDQETELAGAIGRIESITGLDADDIRAIILEQQHAITELAVTEEVGERKHTKKKIGARILGYGVLGIKAKVALMAAFGVASVGGAMAVVGAVGAGMVVARGLDYYITDKQRRKKRAAKETEIRAALAGTGTTPAQQQYAKDIRHDLMARIALRKQCQINEQYAVAVHRSVEQARQDWQADPKNPQKREALQAAIEERTRDLQQSIEFTLEREYAVGDDAERTVIASAIASMNEINETSLLLEEEAFADEARKRAMPRKKSRLDFLQSRTLGEQLTTSSIFASAGVLALEVPVLRNVLMGYAGYRLGSVGNDWMSDFVRKHGNEKTQAMTIKKMQSIVSRGDPGDINYYIGIARKQLSDPQYQRYFIVRDRAELQRLIAQGEEILMKNRAESSQAVVGRITDNLAVQIKRDYFEIFGKKINIDNSLDRLFRIGGAVIGACIPEIIASYMHDHPAAPETAQPAVAPASPDAAQATTPPAAGGAEPIEPAVATTPDVASQPTVDATPGSGTSVLTTEQNMPGTVASDADQPVVPLAAETPASAAHFPADIEAIKSNLLGWIQEHRAQFDLSIVHKGEGVTHALSRQLEADPKNYGFTGDVNNHQAVHHWAILEAKQIAIDNKYIETDGHGHITGETRVAAADKMSYILTRDSSGKFHVLEQGVDENASNINLRGDTRYAGNLEKPDEYHHGHQHGAPASGSHPLETHVPDTAHLPDDTAVHPGHWQPGIVPDGTPSYNMYAPSGSAYSYIGDPSSFAGHNMGAEAGLHLGGGDDVDTNGESGISTAAMDQDHDQQPSGVMTPGDEADIQDDVRPTEVETTGSDAVVEPRGAINLRNIDSLADLKEHAFVVIKGIADPFTHGKFADIKIDLNNFYENRDTAFNALRELKLLETIGRHPELGGDSQKIQEAMKGIINESSAIPNTVDLHVFNINHGEVKIPGLPTDLSNRAYEKWVQDNLL